MKNFSIAKSRRLRGTPYTSRIEKQGVTAYTIYNHMLLPAAFGSTEESYHHLKEHVQIWDVAAERQVEISGKDSAKLVLLGGSNKMPVHPDLINLANNGDSDAVKLMMKWGYEGSKKFIGGNPVEKIIQSPRDIREILAVDLVACNNYSNGSDAAKLIECPSLLIFGSLDKMVNLEAGKKFSSLVKNSKTHIIDGCGHMIMIEKAFEMREKVLEFLKK